MSARIRNKKLIFGAVAVVCSAVAASVAVAVTYAAYRSEVLSGNSASVAGAVADYVRGDAVRNFTEPIEFEQSDSTGGIVISDLSPGDVFDYSFSVNGYRESSGGTAYNQVLLRITCEFSFTYAYPVQESGDAVVIEHVPLSAVAYESRRVSVVFMHDYGTAAATTMDAEQTANAGDVAYRDPDAGVDWKVTQHADESGMLVQKFGFYVPPVSSADDEGASNSFAFRVSLPENNVGSGMEDYSEQFRLTVNMKITAEQVLETSVGTTA